MITRRELMLRSVTAVGYALVLPSRFAIAQGISSRGMKPQPRGKPSGRPFLAHFTDVAKQAGLSEPIVYGGVETKNYIVEVVGAGVAFIDYENDGWMDLFVLSGTRLEGDLPGVTNRLYKNNRDGTFNEVTAKAGLIRAGWASGVTVADYDNDGFDDLFVTYFGHNVLYHNNGDGTFTDVSEQAGVAGSENRWGAGCCFLDYDRDGQLDLFVANYVNFDPAHAPKPGQAAYCMYNDIPVPCGPLGFAGGTKIG